MYKYQQLAVFFLLVSFTACKKDPVPDPGVNPGTQAVFQVTDPSGNCYTSNIQGTYTIGIALGFSNLVTVQVNVSQPGSYVLNTIVNNGMKFSASGVFATTGVQTVSLQGTGTPVSAINTTFALSAGNSTCSFIIPISGGAPVGENDNMYFGNISNAAQLIDSANNFLMRKTYYTLSYSRDRGIPNWVSWHLYGPDLGSVSRQDDFREDATLPAEWYHVQDVSYNGGGFDRGHNIPSGDRTSSVEANSSTFLMTNMIPQAPYLNQNPWARMEDSLRRLVTMGAELYIVMGSYGTGGTGTNGFVSTINGGKVTVPANIWKVAVVLPNGTDDSSRVNSNTRVIAVSMPNTNNVNANWKNYRISIDAIESATGYDLLKKLPTALQAVLEAKIDNL